MPTTTETVPLLRWTTFPSSGALTMTVSQAPDYKPVLDKQIAAVESSDLHYLIDEERVQSGRERLSFHNALQKAAFAQAWDMGARDYVNHIAPAGETLNDRLDLAGYKLWDYAGEILLAGFPDSVSALRAIMRVSACRVLALDSHFSDIGIAFSYDRHDNNDVRLADGTRGGPFFFYWSIVFGHSLAQQQTHLPTVQVS